MPRNAKRMQTPAAPQDQGYGQRGEQIAAQQVMGIPDNQNPAQPTVPAPPAGTSGNITSPDQLLEMLKGEAPPPPGGLTRPSERPSEPITTGLNVEQPVQPMPQNKAADTLDQIAAVTGDERFVMLANRARMV